MKGRTLNLAVLAATLAVPLSLFLAETGASVIEGNLILLVGLGGGLVAGNVLLWRYAARERYRRVGRLVQKGVLFNAGWTLALGVLIAVSLAEERAAAQAAEAKAEAAREVEALRLKLDLIEVQLREAEQALEASGDQEAMVPLKRERFLAFVSLLDGLEAGLQSFETEADLADYARAIQQQTQRIRPEVTAKLEQLQSQAPPLERPPTADKTDYDRLRVQRDTLTSQLANPRTVPLAAMLPALWRYLLCVLGFIMAATGLVVADETFIAPLLRLFPFFKSEERKKSEEAEAAFEKMKHLHQEGKTSKAAEQSEKLDTESLSTEQRREAEFCDAYTAFEEYGADKAIPFLEKLHRDFPDFYPTTYLLGYVYLVDDQYDKALPMWEQMHGHDPEYLETTYHYSCALLALARQLMREARVNEALPLFKQVRELGIHADVLPEGIDNAWLMEATAKLRDGAPLEAKTIFAKVENDGRAKQTPEGKRLEALGKLGHTLVFLHEGYGVDAANLLDEVLETIHTLSGIDRPPEYAAEDLLTPFRQEAEPTSAPAAEQEAGQEDRDETSSEAESPTAAAPSTIQNRELLRDLYFLRGVVQILVWSSTSSQPEAEETSRNPVLLALRRALHFEPAFADALALYGFVLFFYSSNRQTAATFLKQARNAGFEHEALIVLLQNLEALSQIRARTKTEILDRLHEYFTNEEVPLKLKERLLEEEAILNGYQEHHGDIELEDVKERQPTLADLTARSDYLGKEISRILQEWEGSGTEQQKLDKIKKAMTNLRAQNEDMAKVKERIEEEENTVLHESGIFVFSEEF